MSRKSVQISIPASGAAPAVPAKAPTRKNAGVDSWVAQADDALGEDVFAAPFAREGLTFTVKLSTDPDWSEAMKIFFFLPQAALWFWSVGMARRFTRGPYIWRG